MRLRETRAASDLCYPLAAPASRGDPSSTPRGGPWRYQCALCTGSPLPSWARVGKKPPRALACPPSPPKSHTLGSRVCSFLHLQHLFALILMLIRGLSTLAGEGPSPVGYSVVYAIAPRNLPPDSSLQLQRNHILHQGIAQVDAEAECSAWDEKITALTFCTNTQLSPAVMAKTSSSPCIPQPRPHALLLLLPSTPEAAAFQRRGSWARKRPALELHWFS